MPDVKINALTREDRLMLMTAIVLSGEGHEKNWSICQAYSWAKEIEVGVKRLMRQDAKDKEEIESAFKPYY